VGVRGGRVGSGGEPCGSAQKPFVPTREQFGSVQKPFAPAQKPFGSGQKPFVSIQKPFVPTQKPFGSIVGTTLRTRKGGAWMAFLGPKAGWWAFGGRLASGATSRPLSATGAWCLRVPSHYAMAEDSHRVVAPNECAVCTACDDRNDFSDFSGRDESHSPGASMHTPTRSWGVCSAVCLASERPGVNLLLPDSPMRGITPPHPRRRRK